MLAENVMTRGKQKHQTQTAFPNNWLSVKQKRDNQFTLKTQNYRVIEEEDMRRLLSQRSTWQTNVPGAEREGQTATRGSLCCPTCPEVLLLCSNPHPITLSTWGRSLISSVMCLCTRVCMRVHTHALACAGGDTGLSHCLAFECGKTLIKYGSWAQD